MSKIHKRFGQRERFSSEAKRIRIALKNLSSSMSSERTQSYSHNVMALEQPIKDHPDGNEEELMDMVDDSTSVSGGNLTEEAVGATLNIKQLIGLRLKRIEGKFECHSSILLF